MLANICIYSCISNYILNKLDQAPIKQGACMNLTVQQIREFMTIYKQVFGEPITEDDARKEALTLIVFVRAILKRDSK